MTLSIMVECCYALSFMHIVENVSFMLSVITLNVIMLSVLMLSVVN